MKLKLFGSLKIETSLLLLLFFISLAILEIFKTQNWIAVGYWSLIAFMFFLLGKPDKITEQDYK